MNGNVRRPKRIESRLLAIPTRSRERLIRLAYALAHEAVRLSAPMLKETKMVSKRMTETTITRSKKPEALKEFQGLDGIYLFVCEECGHDFYYHLDLEPGEIATPNFCPSCGRRAKT